MIYMIAQYVHKAIEAATPWLVVTAAGFFVLWLIILCHKDKPFAKELKWFFSLTPLHKFVIICTAVFFTLLGGSKERVILPSGMIDDISSTMSRIVETVQPRSLPEDVSTNALAVTDFAVDTPNQNVTMEVTCASNLFDYTDSRYLDIFMSTNLTDNYYFWIKDFLMPEGTNSHVVSISESAGDTESQAAFTNAFGDKAFFIVAADIDSDGDGLTDTYETRTSFTNPLKADTDGDGIHDGRELRPWIGTNPLLYDTDGDGVGDGDEIAAGSNPLSCDSDGDGLSDAAELGSMTACVDDNFLWFDLSDATGLIESSSTSWTIGLSQAHVINDLCYTNARVQLYGTVHLLCPTNVNGWAYECDYGTLSNSQYSSCHVTIALCGTSLYAKTDEWGSQILHGAVQSDGKDYTVVEYRNIGLQYYSDTNELITCQLIIPHSETNTIYVSYLCASNTFRSIGMVAGVQCGWMPSIRDGEDYYNLSWPITADFPSDGLTIKYSIGTFTDPNTPDTDGDGLSDHEEIVVRKTNPLNRDTDDDGLYDGEEIAIGIDPCAVDSDLDGLWDGTEVVFGSDPLMSDTDGDGVDDFIEHLIDSNPTTAHSDGDAWSDREELGYVVELPQEEFLWLDVSGGENLLGNNSTLNSKSWPIAMGGDFVVNELCYTNARVCLDGMVYLLNPTNSSSSNYSDGYNYNGGFSNSYFSSTHTALSGYNANMYAKSAWGSALLHGTVSTNGHAYKVVEYRNIGHYTYQNTNDVLLTYQLIFPMHETNVFYVSYLHGDPLFETFNPLVGMQCPTMKSVVNTNQNYSLSWKMRSGALDTPLTLKFTTGTGTHPAKTDTDGDGLSDSNEILLHRTNPRNPDCDGDGLPDGAEVAAGTDPFSGDSDDDGIPDGWEVQHGLDPHSDDSFVDNDSDGLPNIYEYRNSTNPSETDSDEDGLPDIVEAAWLSTSESVPWFDMAGATVVSPNSNVDTALYDCEIPFPAKILALPVTVAVADVNGVVYLGNSAATNGLWSTHGERDMADDLNFSSIAVSPYWTDLYLRTTLGSEISYKTVGFNGQNYFVLQYKRVGTWSGDTNEVSFQMSIPESSPSNVVYVRYGTLIDARGSGYKVSVGAQGFANLAKLPVSHAMPSQTPVTNGMVVAYHFGCGSDPAVKDTDEDGVRDDVELLHGTNPRNSDTDNDGMTDEFEIRYGLNPCSSEGVNGLSGDFDGDFLSNDKEREYNTNLSVPDSDGDCVVDGLETGSVFATNAIPWLVFDACEDITSAISTNYNRCLNRPLPAALRIQGETVTNLTISANGLLFLNKAGYSNPGNSTSSANFTYSINDNALVLAPYLQYAYIRSDIADRQTSIKYGTATYDGEGYLLVEYLNSFYNASSYQTNSISFQIAIPTNTPDRAYSRYLDVTGQYMDGRYASIGMQTFDGKWLHSWCHHAGGKVESGLALEFLFGVNSNPLVPDSDGDGLADGQEVAIGTSPAKEDSDGDFLPDGWEFQHGLNPLSTDGDDGDAGDPDGDGVDNLNEYEMGTNPNAADTDNDGLSDGEEAVCVSFAMSLPWLEFTTITNLTGVIADSYGCISIDLPSPVAIQQEIVTNITIDVDGVVFFNKAGYVNPGWTGRPYDFDDEVADPNCFTVAPYWDWLFLSDEAAPSSVKLGTATVGADGYYVLECKHLYRNLNSYETNSISFQVTFPTGYVDRIYVRYADVVGDEMDGRYALIRCQSFDARENVTYCSSEQGMVYEGMGLCFVVGCGSDPTKTDTDGDGIADNVEIVTHGSDPRSEDTDDDGLSDSDEIALGTSILNPDSDGDGLLDGWEVTNGFNPLSRPGQGEADGDADEDGLTNIEEQLHGGNPRNGDTDDDGLPDPMEIARGTNISLGDTDHDGLLDGLEVSFGTNPLQPDTDSDGMNDGWEYQHRAAGFDPRVDNARDRNPDNDIDADPDGDKLTNGQECEWGTNPVNADTDGDGVNDGAEVGQNSDPDDASDDGRPNTRIPITFHFGDPSGSHSEKYRLEVTPVSGHGETPASFSWLNENYGECETKKAMLKPGWKYEVRLYHAGTDPDYDSSPRPDYDYELSCDRATVTESVIVVDDDGLFDGCDDGEVFTAAGKVAVIYVLGNPKVIPDYNRDGKIDSNDESIYDAHQTVFRFWINNDNDSGNVNDSENDRPGSGSNGQDDKVNGRSDLLDFTPVLLDVSGVFPPETPDSIRKRVSWKLQSSVVNAVWTSLSASGAGNFLKTDCGAAFGLNLSQNAHEAAVDRLVGGKKLPDGFAQRMKNAGGRGVVMIEGRDSGVALRLQGYIDESTTPNIEGTLNINVSSVEDMYRFVTLRGAHNNPNFTVQIPGRPRNHMDNGKDLDVFFTHGFNVSESEAHAWGSEVFKRLWQSGSNARFWMFTWSGDYNWISHWFNGLHYQQDVYQALKTGAALKAFVEEAQPDSSKRILMTQSLGNMVACEALRLELAVNKYFMFNAAVASEAVDDTLQAKTPNDNGYQKYVPSDWYGYTNLCWAANWYRWFNSDAIDARGKIGWPAYFSGAIGNAQSIYNYYSTGDEVFAETTGTPWVLEGMSVSFANYAWQKQEVLKGSGGPGGTAYGGWCFHNWTVQELEIGIGGVSQYVDRTYKYSISEANAMVSDGSVTNNPVFNRDADEMFDRNAPINDQRLCLAKYVPAVSSAIGGIDLEMSTIANDDLNSSKYRHGWGRPTSDNASFWLHSDMKDMAYFYVYPLYDELVNEKGSLR